MEEARLLGRRRHARRRIIRRELALGGRDEAAERCFGTGGNRQPLAGSRDAVLESRPGDVTELEAQGGRDAEIVPWGPLR